jgi:hypothetical protein
MTQNINIQGKWANIKKYVKDLELQGWVVTKCEGSADFTYTDVQLQRRLDDDHEHNAR